MLDVARLAGTSQPTVSLVLSGNPRARVAARTRARVLQAAAQLGYVPNEVARALVHRRATAIGLVVPALDNPFFADVVSGAQRVAAQAGYAVLLCEAREIPVAQHLDVLRARQIDGVIMDAVGAALLDPDDLTGLTVVLIDEPNARWQGVASDAERAGRLAGTHLLDLGHRELGFIGPAIPAYSFRMRERGFVQVLREADLRLTSPRLRRAEPSIQGGEGAMRALLTLRARPTAVFCATDLLALGALKACQVLGIRVPQELSLMGCDGIEMTRVVTPELTTVAVPARELGARAARLVVNAFAGRPAPEKPGRPLPVRLLARGSTGPAPHLTPP